MSCAYLGNLLEHLRKTESGCGAGLIDADLLRRFALQNDEAAFAMLVKRHGPMVFRVCRRVLDHIQDAEDAFQATFLILARRAATIRKRDSLASWLHGVALRMASNAKRAAGRRRAYEKQAPTKALQQPDRELLWREVQEALDKEVRRLPEKYRVVFVSCCLEGESRVDVARELGLKEGTISSRLAEARRLLKQRLGRRGITLTAVLTAVALSQGTGRGKAPAELVQSTVRAANSLTRGIGPAAGGVPKKVLELMAPWRVELSGIQLGILVSSLAAAVFLGVTALARQSPPNDTPFPQTALSASNPAPQKKGRTDRYGDSLPEGAIARIGTLRFRQGGGQINRVLATPDGRTVISKSFYGDRSIRVWDFATGRLLHQFPGHYEENRAIALSPDGKMLAVGQDKFIQFRDLASGKEVRRLENPHGGNTDGLAFSPDGKILVSGHEGIEVLLWDLASGRVKTTLKAKHNRSTLLAFSPDGKTLATGDTLDPTIRLFDVNEGAERLQIAQTSHVHDFAFSPDGGMLAAGARDGGVSLWDPATGKLLREMTSPKRYVLSVAWSPDGKALAAGEYHLTENTVSIRLWDPSTGKEIRQMNLGETLSIPGSLAFTSDGKTLISGGTDSIVRLWDPATGQEKSPAAGLPLSVYHLAISPDGKTLAYTTRGIALWDLNGGREIGTLPGRHWSFAFSPDGKTLAGGSADRNVTNVWNLADHQIKQTLAIDIQKESLKWAASDRIAFSPDGKMLAAGGREFDGTNVRSPIRLWDLAMARELRRYDFKQSEKELAITESVTFSPDGKLLVASGRTGNWGASVRLWDVATGKELIGVQDAINSSLESPKEARPDPLRKPESFRVGPIIEPRIVFSPDGRLLAMNRPQATILVWEAATGQERCRLQGHETDTSCVAFSADGRTLASSGWDYTIRLWDVETAKELKRFSGHRGLVNALAFTPDGRMLISGSDDTTVLFWDVAELAGRPRPVIQIARAELDALWTDLAALDAGKAHRALARIAADPATTVAALQDRLKPAPTVDPAQLIKLMGDLRDDDFAIRERASQELAKLGEAAAAAIEKARAGDDSPEVRRRCDELLRRLAFPSDDRIQAIRAVEALERIGTPEARKVLESVSRGDSSAKLTREAKAALERLKRTASIRSQLSPTP